MGGLDYDTAASERLLRTLAEQLKLPLLQIAREAEFADATQDAQALSSIRYTADMALRLVDSYLLSVQLRSMPLLDLEPVSVSAVLQETAHSLGALAKQYDCELEVHLGGKYQPVMAHRQSLESAFVTLGHAFIESQPNETHVHRVLFGAHRSQRGLVAGIFGAREGSSADALKRGRALLGTARQVLPGLSPAAGAGVFVADSLLANMEAPLHVSRHNNLVGLAATLVPSQQLQLV